MIKLLNSFFIVFCFTGFGIISFIPDLLGFPAQATTITYRAVIAALSLVLILLYIPSFKTSVKVTSILSILLITVYCLRLVNDSDLDFGRNFNEIIALSIGAAFLPAIALYTIQDNRIIISTFDLIIFFFFIICLMAFLNGDFFLNSRRLAGNSILNPITLGHIAVSGIILLIVKLTYLNDLNYGNRNLLWLYFCLFVFLIILIMASSRGPVVSLILTLGYFIIPKINLKKINGLALFSATIVIMGFIFLASNDFTDDFKNRMFIDLGGNQSYGEARIYLWSEGIKIFLENPIFGKQTTTSMGYPHNIFIEMLMAFGITGTAVFFYILIKCFNKINRLREMNSLLVWPGLLFIQYLIGSFFSGTIYSSTMLWYSTALVLTINLNHFRNIQRTI